MGLVQAPCAKAMNASMCERYLITNCYAGKKVFVKKNRDFFRCFRKFLDVFAIFSRLSDVFGPIRMRSDLLGCIRMHSDAFGSVWTHSKKFANFWIFESFFIVLNVIFTKTFVPPQYDRYSSSEAIV